MIELPELVLGPKLGDGASGEVLSATHQGQQVAVKFFRWVQLSVCLGIFDEVHHAIIHVLFLIPVYV